MTTLISWLYHISRRISLVVTAPVVPILLVAAFFVVLLLLLPATAGAQEPVTPPDSIPSAENGLQIFAERCASCHGPLGAGDGEMALQLPRPPAALGSVEYRQRAVPAHIFDVITNGIIDAGMPPFGPGNSDPLTAAERWDLVAAVYSLGARQALVDEGQAAYEEGCQACHGSDGDGENAPAVGLRDQAFWMNRSDQEALQALMQPDIPEHETFDLEEDTLQAIIVYARTFTYDYADPLAAFAPVESAQIGGVVLNQTTGQPLAEGVPATLSAFTSDFEPSLTMTTTLDAQGQFQFDLEMAPPDLVYVVTVQHEGISYGSDFARLQREDPTLNLEVPVYDPTTDAAAVAIEQLHIILQFVEGQVQVSELYQFSQSAPAVFVGESGDPQAGTVQIAIPDGASEPDFDRSFGGMESFFPADNVIATAEGWADTVPLRPGQNSMSLLVRYALPYEDGLSISHPVYYEVRHTNLVLPEVGVELRGDGWQEGEPQAMGQAGLFRTFTRSGASAGDPVTFSIAGEPRMTTGAAPGARVPGRDQTAELLVGGGVLLLALAAGAYTIRRWRQREATPEAVHALPAADDTQNEPDAARLRRELLQAIIALDDAYEAGELDEGDYNERRNALKEQLIAIWES